MNGTSSASVLATRLKRKIARRLRLARLGKALFLPTAGATFLLARWNEWLGLGGVALLLLEVIAIVAGELQRCPLCDTPLVIRRDWDEEFAGTCPECGNPID